MKAFCLVAAVVSLLIAVAGFYSGWILQTDLPVLVGLFSTANGIVLLLVYNSYSKPHGRQDH